MRNLACVLVMAAGGVLTSPLPAGVIYNNLTPNNLMAMATRSGSPFEIETADDFVLATDSAINAASFDGLMVPGVTGVPSISQVILEIYRVFPLDSDTSRTPNVPTRVNSPPDVAFDLVDSALLDFTFTVNVLNGSFTALNSVQPGGIHPKPGQTTGGNGTLTGQEVQIDATLANPLNLPAGHYFFVPQVQLSNGGTFYWLSASRPISGTGTTAISPDLQAWTRDQNLDPDWLRVGTDIVGGTTPPTFNAAFSLAGVALPEPAGIVLIVSGLALVVLSRRLLARQ